LFSLFCIQTDLPLERNLLFLIPLGLLVIILLVRLTRLWNHVEEPKKWNFLKLILYLLIEIALLMTTAFFEWITPKFVLMIYQTFGSPDGKILANILYKLLTSCCERNSGSPTVPLVQLHPSSSRGQISESPTVPLVQLHPSSSRWQISGSPTVPLVEPHPCSSRWQISGSPTVPLVEPHPSSSRWRISRSPYFLRSSSRSRLRRRGLRLSQQQRTPM
jgi:hypothetical protein